MRRGYTLVNHLLGLLVVLLLLHLATAVFRILVMHSTPVVDQHQVFSLQIRQLFYRTNAIACAPDRLTIGEFDIVFDRNRLVKRPGYEILLQGVDDGIFICDSTIRLRYQAEGKDYELIIENTGW